MKSLKHLLTLFFLFLCFIYFIPTHATAMSFSGIDVSKWQGDINFNAVKATGVDIVYIRVAEGTNYEDPYWKQNYENAKAAGLKIGFYHYMTTLSEYEAQEQATYFYNLIKDCQMDCLPVMDFESFSILSTQEINKVAMTYLETLYTLTGVRPMLYSDINNITSIWSDTLSSYPLWVAEYDVSKPEILGCWSDWTGFQFSDTGSIKGINSDVDMDYFKESIFIQTSTTTSHTTSTSTTTKPSTPITYTVKSGDTLWQIANSYVTTISELVTLNHLSNPNLIYPGEELLIPSSSVTSSTPLTYTVESGDTLWQISNSYNTTVSDLVTLNHIQNASLIYPGETLLLPRK